MANVNTAGGGYCKKKEWTVDANANAHAGLDRSKQYCCS